MTLFLALAVAVQTDTDKNQKNNHDNDDDKNNVVATVIAVGFEVFVTLKKEQRRVKVGESEIVDSKEQ